MPQIVVLATGGTIASSRGSDGASVATRGAKDLLAGLENSGIRVKYRDLFRLGSYLLEHRHLRLISEAVAQELANPEVDGVVVTHGTDTMEETAYLLDLVHDSDKPVVLTGAQRPADVLDSDGPANLRDAIALAADPGARANGAMISFAGGIYAARGTGKTSTIAQSPFQTSGGGPLGHTRGGRVTFNAKPIRPPASPRPTADFDATRVDVVSVHPGADASLAIAAVAAGASGVIIAGTGMGNGNQAILQWVQESISAGIPVGLATRVAEGPVVPFYGNGGGADLVRAGAVPLGSLPLFQARILLALLLSRGLTVTPELIDPFI